MKGIVMSVIVDCEKLSIFVKNVFSTYGLTPEDAFICSDNLVKADLRGVHSHGVARLKRYVDSIESGQIFPLNKPSLVRETPSTAAVDGNAGLGQIVGHFSTRLAIDKAKKTGIGMVTVRNSNHYGIARYYSEMILHENMIGISMTNSAPLVVPTFGKEMVMGTNPISFAAPAQKNRPFFLDMATSVVPRGKLEVYGREGKAMPEGWAVDEKGKSTQNPAEVLQNMLKRSGGGILPLGGEGELFSGYKGYGLAMLVDILCGVLSGGAYADLVYGEKDGSSRPPDVGHFFMAIRIENFIDLETFREKMDDFISRVRNSAKAEGHSRIYIHGEKEYELFEKHQREGVPVQEKVYETLKGIAKGRNVEFIL